MDILNTFKISGSALKANKIRLDTISSNMANVETTSEFPQKQFALKMPQPRRNTTNL